MPISDENQTPQKPRCHIGEGIGFAGLCGAAAWVEVSGGNALYLWILIFVWAFFAGWSKSSD